MPIPNELRLCVERYRSCESYSDGGTVARRAREIPHYLQSADFGTQFHRGKELRFWGKSRGSIGSGDLPIAAPQVGNWLLTYDWDTATLVTELSESDNVKQATGNVLEMLEVVSGFSFQCADVIPFLILDSSSRFWQELEELAFQKDEADDGRLKLTGIGLKRLVEIEIDLKSGLLASILQEQEIQDLSQVHLLEKSLQLFGTPSSQDRLRTLKTMDILSKREESKITIQSAFQYSSATIK